MTMTRSAASAQMRAAALYGCSQQRGTVWPKLWGGDGCARCLGERGIAGQQQSGLSLNRCRDYASMLHFLVWPLGRIQTSHSILSSAALALAAATSNKMFNPGSCTTTLGWRGTATSMRTWASWRTPPLIWSWPSNRRLCWRKSRWWTESSAGGSLTCSPSSLWPCFLLLRLPPQFSGGEFGDDKASASDSSSRLSFVERNSRALSLHNSITKSKSLSSFIKVPVLIKLKLEPIDDE